MTAHGKPALNELLQSRAYAHDVAGDGVGGRRSLEANWRSEMDAVLRGGGYEERGRQGRHRGPDEAGEPARIREHRRLLLRPDDRDRDDGDAGRHRHVHEAVPEGDEAVAVSERPLQRLDPLGKGQYGPSGTE